MTLEQFEEAEPILLEAFETSRGSLGDGHETTRSALLAVVDLYRRWGRPELAAHFERLVG